MIPRILCVLLMSGLSACATKPRSPNGQQVVASPAPEGSSEPVVITRYELGTYRYPNDGRGQNRSAIIRRTRVPASVASAHAGAATNVAAEYVPASFDPLPPSAELAAELAAQKTITEELRAIKNAIVEMEQKARAQFEALVRRTDEAVEAREKLEAEIVRVRAVEAELRERFAGPPPATESEPVATSTGEVKW